MRKYVFGKNNCIPNKMEMIHINFMMERLTFFTSIYLYFKHRI